MRAGRWAGAATCALVLAVLPGALQLVAHGDGPERAIPLSLGMLDPSPTAADQVLPGPLDQPIIPPGDDLAGELAPAAPAPAPFGRSVAQRAGVVALVVGINDYPGSRSDLGAAVADADTIDAALAGFGVPASNRVVLRDGQARRPQLVGALRALVASAGPDTTVVFAYAGHVRKLGRSTEAIVAADGGLLRDTELAGILAPLTAQPVWLLMASCYAGGFTEALAPGRILTAAADANSLAYESPSIHGSYLVHHMVREGWLEGRAGPSVQEAFAYAQARIDEQYPERKAVELDELRTPLTFGSGRTASAGTPAPAPTGGSPSSGSHPDGGAPSPTTTEPPKQSCTLVVLCRRE